MVILPENPKNMKTNIGYLKNIIVKTIGYAIGGFIFGLVLFIFLVGNSTNVSLPLFLLVFTILGELIGLIKGVCYYWVVSKI